MSKNTLDIRTLGYVLRRTNYGEADRILSILTTNGKISAIARAARKEKSKLAGGIEMFCLSDFNIHKKNSDIGIVTGARMIKFHSNLIADLPRLELASTIIKKVNIATDTSDNPHFFKLIDQTLSALNTKINPTLVETWFWFNFAKDCGEEVNLYRDTNGDKLSQDQYYLWDTTESALKPHDAGNIGTNEIKMMRLMLSSDLSVVQRVKNYDSLLQPILFVARAVSKN